MQPCLEKRVFGEGNATTATRAGGVVVVFVKRLSELQAVFPAIRDADDNTKLLKERDGTIHARSVHLRTGSHKLGYVETSVVLQRCEHRLAGRCGAHVGIPQRLFKYLLSGHCRNYTKNCDVFAKINNYAHTRLKKRN